MNPLITIRYPPRAQIWDPVSTLSAWRSLYNIFKVMELLPEHEYRIEAHGEGQGTLRPFGQPCGQGLRRGLQEMGREGPGLSLWCHNIIPSAGARELCRCCSRRGPHSKAPDVPRCGRGRLLRIDDDRGHPDNVAPCFLGGMVVSCWDGEELRYVRLPALPPEVLCVVAVPNERVKTSDARKALPGQVPFEDAVFNLGRAALLTAAWATGKWEYLKWGMDDRLHQQYRSKLFKGGEVIFSRVRDLPECLSVAISGSGPSVIALVNGPTQRVAEAMCRDLHGARVGPSSSCSTAARTALMCQSTRDLRMYSMKHGGADDGLCGTPSDGT